MQVSEVTDKWDMESTTSSHMSMQSVKSLSTDCKELLINPNCPSKILMDFIATSVSLEKDANFDLCDEKGVLTKIGKCTPTEYATKVLKPKQIYFVVCLEKDSTKMTPLLIKNSKFYAELLRKLKTNNTPSTTRRKSGTIKGGSLSTNRSFGSKNSPTRISQTFSKNISNRSSTTKPSSRRKSSLANM